MSSRFAPATRGVSEVGSLPLATGYQQVRSVVAALAGTGQTPPNATNHGYQRFTVSLTCDLPE